MLCFIKQSYLSFKAVSNTRNFNAEPWGIFEYNIYSLEQSLIQAAFILEASKI